MLANYLKEIPRRTNSLVLHPHVKAFIGYNFIAYGLYKLTSGPTKNNFRKRFIIEPGSSMISAVTAHLFPTDFFNMLTTSAVIYTIGNRHIWKYGTNHFWKLAILGAVGGTLLAKTASNSEYSGALASASAFACYNAVRNPSWFWLGSFPTLIALMAYSVYYNDKAFGGGAFAGYIAFLFAL
ncbi:unnamed protein product [Moneuplotes crassus]|uniref:Uncharacterized protein n=2 Tax=Euplotes crassus TaxID=5936 RepID=A0AAD1Y1Q1_EUPCR|nr:unnamed protein product [Moneuplotes crassus]